MLNSKSSAKFYFVVSQKNSESQTSAGNRSSVSSAYVDPSDMLNNFCFRAVILEFFIELVPN